MPVARANDADFSSTLPGEPSERSAFTLIEMLVVIVVVAVLISFLLPAFSGARRASRSAACLSQLRTLGHALLGYTEDNRGVLPYGYSTLDLSAKHIEPWRTIADRLELSMPFLNENAGGTTGAPWWCPSESRSESSSSACSYGYPPGEFMRLWIPGRRPEPPVTKMFRLNPELALLLDSRPNHAVSQEQRDQSDVAGSGRNGFFFDASARTIK